MTQEPRGPREPRHVDDLRRAVDALMAPVDEREAAHAAGRPLAGWAHPVHTAYVPADGVVPGVLAHWSAGALDALDRHAGGPAGLAEAVGWPAARVEAVWERLRGKLTAQPVEDLRVDAEDGYGVRPDDVEDADVRAAARTTAALLAGAMAPACVGVRTKSLHLPTRGRALRTVALFVHVLAAGAPPPSGWRPGAVRWTLPKVSSHEEVAAAAGVCQALETGAGLPAGTLALEVQVETPAAILDPAGTAPLPAMIAAGGGRVVGLHYGTYDYATGIGIPPAHQSAAHPGADHAKAVMQVAAALAGVDVSDGSSNLLPVGSRAQVHAAWRVHAGLVGRALTRGFPAGWDLHPAQLVTRYLAAYDFYRTGLEPAAARLRDYLAGARSGVLDEPATARALARFLLRGWDCGALDPAEVAAASGLGARARPVLEEAAGGGKPA